MRISLGKGTGKLVTRVSLYHILAIRRDPADSNTWENSISDWETPKELMDYIQSLFGPSSRFVD